MNKIKIIASALTALLCVSGTVMAFDRDGAGKYNRLAGSTAPNSFSATAPKSNSSSHRIAELEEFDRKLDQEHAFLKKAGVASATPMYVEAKGRVKETLVEERARGNQQGRKVVTEAKQAFTVCSTHVTAVLMQFERERNLVNARRMAAERDSMLIVLHNLHEAISRIEGGRAFKLAQDLEATKGKAADLQSDLEATKGRAAHLESDLEATRGKAADLQSDLEATRGIAADLQSDLAATQASLAAERERLRQVMEDAQKRLNELQSDLINVSKDARGTIISMSDILFETGRANLTANLKTNLARIAGILMVYKEPNILVEGHTDNVGSRERNQKLSEDRAKNVMNFISENGVAPERLTAIGSAFDKPIADNSTPEGRAKNRRVDLIIMEEELDYGQKKD